MNICDFMQPELVLLDSLKADDKKHLLQQLVQILREKNYLTHSDDVVKALMDREQRMSTGIKYGYAIPHAFTEQIENSLVVFARLQQPVDYKSFDSQPVDIVFLLLGPPREQGIHLKILARLAMLLSLGNLHNLFLNASSPREVIDIVRDHESKFNVSANDADR